jgi:hypothetical protein
MSEDPHRFPWNLFSELESQLKNSSETGLIWTLLSKLLNSDLFHIGGFQSRSIDYDNNVLTLLDASFLCAKCQSRLKFNKCKTVCGTIKLNQILAPNGVIEKITNVLFFSPFPPIVATTQPTTQNNLKQLLLGWLYYR